MSGCPDYDALKALSKELDRPVSSLIALVPQNDPFYSGMPSNREQAEWFANLWREYGIDRARHIRRVHYILQAQPHGTVLMRDGSPYENTDECWAPLAVASKHARYLGLVDPDALIDRRNPEPLLYWQPLYSSPGSIWIGSGGVWELQSIEKPHFPDLPKIFLHEPARKRPVMVEVWVEKAGDLDDVLMPICERKHVNLIPCKGEQGFEACRKLVARALKARCPVRVLYLSDFDPAGASMPLAVARKIEFELRSRDLELDIQVRPIGLTHQQCVDFRLPRTPIKAKERRAARFEERFGEGATELDALEALHPGELGKIVEAEIARYQQVDPEVNRQFSAVSQEIRDELRVVEEAVLARHVDSLDELRQEHERILYDLSRVQEELEELSEQVGSVFADIRDDLEAERPDLSQWQWPEPSEPNEDPDPLFDSRRGYVEQIDRYKQHQGKPTGRKPNGAPP